MKVTGVGGGHGLAATLRAARLYATEVAAVVTVADDGGSSGRLTRELGIPAPGDIRNCLVALSEESALTRLYQHRFAEGALSDHSLGNLMIAGLTEMTNDFAEAVKRAGEMLGARGVVHPATTEVVSLRASVNGEVVRGQVAVAKSASPIQAVYLKPADVPAHEGAVRAILDADQVVLGPGSLFTSLIATVIVPGIKEALRRTTATKVFVCNSCTQAGETTALSAGGHLEALLAHAGPYAADVVVVQCPQLTPAGVVVDHEALEFSGVEVVEADVAAADGGHDPRRLAEVLRSLV
ncbi:MAG TPA: uridine diphosphate-N-acetylglucosamine-binding protein YvcK [Actinomycetota bacterium]|nr:uridine diphosphate-N-acetylglucosamine-binding protein YvcK [Actinomycetota bacterium]